MCVFGISLESGSIMVVLLSIIGHSMVSLSMFYCYGTLSEFYGYRSTNVLSVWLYTCSYFMLLLLLSTFINTGFTFSVGYYYELILIIITCQYLFSLSWLVYYNLMFILVCVFVSLHCRLSVVSSSVLWVLVVDMSLVDSVFICIALWSCFYSLL